jgi:aspartate ammonia-lyase
MRQEQDFLGKKEIPKNALYGIHSVRAKENFPDRTPFHIEWYAAIGLVKWACYQSYQSFKKIALQEYAEKDIPIVFFEDNIIQSLQEAAKEIADTKHFDSFIIPAIQGGAGTSINLNINEIIANIALLKIGEKPGGYSKIDPIEHANIYQSTNDVIPTALKIALMQLLKNLEAAINKTRKATEDLENKYANTPRMAYTQLQEAVPSTYGRLFSAYSDALSRDWWRVSKAWERIKTHNLGGGAIGNGFSIPRFFIMDVAHKLKDLTRLPLSRAENPSENTSNLDSFVEVSAIIKAHAVNLEKMTNDIRLLASDISKTYLQIPKRQVGSSIMPAKVNPVILEFVISSTHHIYANDQLVTSLSARSDLELNAYLPSIGHALIENLKLLIAANESLEKNVLKGLELDENATKDDFYKSPSITTILSPMIGYHSASNLAKLMRDKNISVFQANEELKILEDQKLKEIMKPENLTQQGFSLKDLM